MSCRRRQGRTGPVQVYEVDLDVPGYQSRHVTIEFVGSAWWHPRVYVDGPAGHDASPHRFPGRGGRELCLWFSGDPSGQRWVPDDGMLMLFGMIAEHLFKEAWWREQHEWLGKEYPHGELTEEQAMTEAAKR